MSYEVELRFFQRILNLLNLPFLIASSEAAVLPMVDMGLRGALGMAQEAMTDWGGRLKNALKERVIYYVADEFCCRYAVLLLPERELRDALIVGPYATEDIDRNWLINFVEQNHLNPDWLPILENHYRRVRYLENEHLLFAGLQALGEQLWGVQQFSTEWIDRGVPESWAPLTNPPEPKLREDISAGVRLIEQRYEAENRLMDLVSRGQAQKAQMMLSHFSKGALERRTEPVRDVRNYSVILNTVMRKAAERGGVHPLYIDRLSSDFARQIELTADWQAFMALWSDMARQYCLLVRKHTTQNYTPLVQKAVTRIDMDLAAELSLRSTARELSVNPSYLSTVFRRETGQTFTDYVNQKRMEHAAYLLSSTQMTVSAVAQSCGISDDNYFTKLFKRYNAMTPKEFRQQQQRFRKR